MEMVEPTKNEIYTATKTVYEMMLANSLQQIVNDEEVTDEAEEEGDEVLSEPDP